MSMLSWFTPKKSVSTVAAPGGLPPESTQPLPWNDTSSPAPVRPLPPVRAPENAGAREHHRVEGVTRREQLYGAVRESLLRVGVLAASYKFKVLALDQIGRQYLVMIDLAPSVKQDTAKASEIESLIRDAAKSRYDILVTAVYWRVDEQLTESPEQPAAATPAPGAPVSRRTTGAATPAVEAADPRHEPLQTEEMLAFKRALAATAAVPAPPGAARPPARSYSPLTTGYEDTQVVSPDTRPPGLGLSQYGDLR